MFRALAQDIAANGLQKRIILYQGKFLDGWNRYRACVHMGVECKAIKIHDEEDAATIIKRVLSENIHRRNMTQSQKAWVAKDYVSTDHGGDRKSDQALSVALEMNIDQAAARFAVGNSTIRLANGIKNAIENGTLIEEFDEALRQARITLREAYRCTDLNKALQKKALENPSSISALLSGKKNADGNAEKAQAKEQKRTEMAEKINDRGRELPDDVFQIVYCDPPWKFETHSEKGMDCSADNHYSIVFLAVSPKILLIINLYPVQWYFAPKLCIHLARYR